ncbi:MAG: ABC transporter permease [Leifsonia sp.]
MNSLPRLTPTPPGAPEASPRNSWRARGQAALVTLRRVAIPIVLALLVGGIVLLATGNHPLEIYGMLVSEAFGSVDRIDATLAAATPLLFTALAAAFSFRAGIFSVGVEGSFVAGGLTGAVIGSQMGAFPPVVAVGVALLGACVAGLMVALVPALLRARWAVDEVVTTLMFNFIVAGLAAWLVQAFFLAKGQANSATAFVASSAELPALNPPNQANVGLIIAIVLVILYAIWSRRSTFGFELNLVGTAPRFAAAQGLRVRPVIFVALIGAGVIRGLGGGVHALGLVHRYSEGFSAGFGFTGIAIALLARFNPIGIVVGAILFGALNAAGSTVQLFVNIPIQLIDVMQGTVMIFALAQIVVPRFLRFRSARVQREVVSS